MKIIVIGAGAWGTAVAVSAAIYAGANAALSEGDIVWNKRPALAGLLLDLPVTFRAAR